MKRFFTLLALSFVFSLTNAQERVALIIGNSNYPDAGVFCKLPSARNDAQDMAAILHDSLDFYVTSVIDATEEEFDDAFDNFKQNAKYAKVIVVYYSGHGLMRGGLDYIVPIYQTDTNRIRKMIQLETIYTDLVASTGEGNLKLFLIDACRNGDGKFISNGNHKELWDKKYVSKLGYPVGVHFIFSTLPSTKSIGNRSGNSLFTEGLMKHICEPVEFTDMCDKVGKYVSRESQKRYKEKQTISKEGNYAGEFYFNSNKWTEYVDSITDKMSFSLLELPDGRVRCKYENGDEYEGGWKSNKKNGYGVLKSADGTRYEGEFKDGKEHGFGTLYTYSGDTIQGMAENGQFEGECIVRSSDGWISEGTFSRSQLNGKGRQYNLKTGESYTGYFKNGYPNGEGVMITSDGGSFIGIFVNGYLEGEGKWTSENGVSYVGSFEKNRFHGQGSLTFPDGQKQEGYFEEDVLNGKGVMINSAGEKSEGVFVDGQLEGPGRFEAPDGSYYIGTFVHGICHGNGKIVWANGSSYEGGFKSNKYDGEGVLTNPRGVKFKGIFKNGELEGEGTALAPDGSTYTGTFLHSLYHGKGEMVNTDGSWYKGEFKEGAPNGVGVMRDSYGNIYEGSFVNGKIEGKGKVTASNGVVYEGDCKNGKADGKGKATSPNGVIFEGEFKNGMMNGKGKFINFFGMEGVTYEGLFLNDNLYKEGVVTFPNGDKHYVTIENGNFVGDARIEYANGCVYVGQIINFQPNGTGRMKCPGEKAQQGQWENGAFIE